MRSLVQEKIRSRNVRKFPDEEIANIEKRSELWLNYLLLLMKSIVKSPKQILSAWAKLACVAPVSYDSAGLMGHVFG